MPPIMALISTLLGLTLLPLIIGQTLPTNYEYFTSEGISSGLSADQSYFLLNDKEMSVYSGAMHYFRIPRAYWRDRLRKLRAAGLNTVETYIPWNIHEPQSGLYEFGSSGSEMEDFAHLEEYIQMAQEEDLFVIIRSGPYICSEYNFGGFPSWLLREKQMGFRTTEETYIKYVTRYFNNLLPVLVNYQFTKGGPIIAFQVENEYGNQENGDFLPQKEYLEILHQLFVQNGIVELLVTSDSPLSHQDKGTLPGIFLQTANLGASVEEQMEELLELQPNRPLMVMEFWIGLYDNWASPHQTKNASATKGVLERILKYPASVNIYMFHGGTNFGFTNGGDLGNLLFDNSGFRPFTSSYDYDAPLTEAGDYTQKYYDIKDLIATYNSVKTYTPDLPELISRIAYPAITIQKQIYFANIIANNAPYVIESENVVAMEMLDINNYSGQSNGYIVYRKENIDLEANTVLKIEGHICDTAVVLVNGISVSPVLETSDDLDKFGYWRLTDSTLVLNSEAMKGATVDIVIEEWGRMNIGNITQYNHTFKGLWQGDVYLNDDKVTGWKIVPLEFRKDWTNNLEGWTDKASNDGPAIFSAVLEISDDPRDTYIDMSQWTKGLVIVNGFPIGKYAKVGPQQALYIPGPFLQKGSNSIIIFEHFKAADELTFVTDQIYNTL